MLLAAYALEPGTGSWGVFEQSLRIPFTTTAATGRACRRRAGRVVTNNERIATTTGTEWASRAADTHR